MDNNQNNPNNTSTPSPQPASPPPYGQQPSAVNPSPAQPSGFNTASPNQSAGFAPNPRVDQPMNSSQAINQPPVEPTTAAAPPLHAETPPPPPPANTASSTGTRSKLAALLLSSSLGIFGVHQLYLGNKSQGWIRLAVTVISLLLTIVFIGFIGLFVMFIWNVIDFIRIAFTNFKDADGQSLEANDRDKVWTKIVAITAIVLTSLSILLSIVSISLGAFSAIQEQARSAGNSVNQSQSQSQTEAAPVPSQGSTDNSYTY